MIVIPKEAKIGAPKLDKYQKVSSFTIPGRGELVKVSVGVNSKIPLRGVSWKQIEKPIKCLEFDNCNVAIRTGVINDITAFDLDLYKMDEDHIFLTTFKGEIKVHFNAFAVRSAKGGIHYYFDYDSDIKQTQNDLGVDIRNDGGIILCPPSKIDNGFYSIVNNVPTIKIPEKLKTWY